MATTRDMHQRIAEWYRQREADDKARLAEITARYGLGPASSMDDVPGKMTEDDGAAVREIMSHKSFGQQTAEIFGDMKLPEVFTRQPRLRRGQHRPDCPHCHPRP